MRIFAYVKPAPNTLGAKLRATLLDELAPEVIAEPWQGPLALKLRFIFRSDRVGATPLREPSVAALTRAVLDELQGIAYVDERQIAALHSGKEYGRVDGIEVSW